MQKLKTLNVIINCEVYNTFFSNTFITNDYGKNLVNLEINVSIKVALTLVLKNIIKYTI